MPDTEFDFSQLFDRRNTRSLKWDQDATGVLPMWVADMDFAAPPPVMRALKKRLDHPVFGYTVPDEEYTRVFVDWQRARNGWDVEAQWLLFSPGVMPLVSLAVETLTSPGDGVVVPVPVYYPFFRAVEGHGRRILRAPLVKAGNSYQFDFDVIERSAREAKMLLLCSPHNPGGRVWTRDELETLAGIAERHDLVIVSDEIHSDLIFPGEHFVPTASIGTIAERVVAIYAPSKTFNIPGIASATAVVPGADLRTALDNALETHMLRLPTTLSLEAAVAAYGEGGEWLDTLCAYLAENSQLIEHACDRDLPGVRPFRQEGTFIQWIDFRERWGTANARVSDRFDEHCRRNGLRLSSGAQFGAEGDGCMRLNFGCPRERLQEGLYRLVRSAETFSAVDA